MGRRARVVAAACLAGLLVAGCADPATDTIRIAMPKAPLSLDPLTASDAASERINTLLYRPLVRLDDTRRPVPGMATWRRTGDGYEFTLREDRATFPDGRQPDAHDVVATYRAVLDPANGSPHRGALAHVSDVDAIDDTRIRVRLSRADPRLPEKMRIGVTPRRDDAQATDERLPQGSGPFRLVSRGLDETLVLERRRDGQAFRFEAVPDPTMRVLKLVRGEVHLLQNDLPAEMYAYAGAGRHIAKLTAAGITFSYLGFNLDDPVVGNVLVRRAIAHAIDRQAIIRHLFLGHADTAETVLHPGHWAANSDLGGHAYDPAEARRLLREAGMTGDRPLRLDYKTSTDPFRIRLAAAIQSQLAEVGIELRVISADWGTFFGDIKAGRFQVYSLSWVGVTSPDILRYLFHSASAPPLGANRGRYRSPLVDDLLDRADRSADAVAAKLYRQAQAVVHGDLVYVPLWYETNVALVRDDIAGYRPDALGSFEGLNRVRWRHAE